MNKFATWFVNVAVVFLALLVSWTIMAGIGWLIFLLYNFMFSLNVGWWWMPITAGVALIFALIIGTLMTRISKTE